MKRPCKHCELDEHTPEVRESTTQLLGVNLCESHRERAVILNKHLLSPESAREWNRQMHELEQKGIAVAI